ncbi:flagellar basal body rod protein FlgC [Legionella israelensis]|uniref:flagellar basal body rod protein FlgC n=1 Tax=Legionella israelensis TaxID=454 RepID=UPI001180ABFD|nr:flagellar basal body rod protein FlgC [Legionella israelensis]QDP73445.1 flagellar basal body rod protein FlgC [Legionella israelensis]
MTMSKIMNVMASAMSAESIRMNIIASNLANSESIGGSEKETYRAKHPVFSEVRQNVQGLLKNEQPVGGVRVTNVIESQKPLEWRYEPNHPLADKQGRIYLTDVNLVEEMADMISASRQYQASVEVLNTSKSLALQVLRAISEL